MFKGIYRLMKWLMGGENYGVIAPKIFTSYELKLLVLLSVLAVTLLWSLARNDVVEGAMGLLLVAGIVVYLSYVKYYRTYKPAMDRWGIRELCNLHHPRQEYRVANRDLLISPDEVKLISMQHGVKLVCNASSQNPHVRIYELRQHYEHRLLTHKRETSMEKKER